MPDEANKRHLQKFGNLFGSKTSDSYLPSGKAKELHKNTMGFKAVKQHATNKNLTIKCNVVSPEFFLLEKTPPNILTKFKQLTAIFCLHVAQLTISEPNGNNKDLSQLHSRGNLTCPIAVEKLCYSAEYKACCCHCGSECKLVTDFNYYPMCPICKQNNEK